MRKVLLLCLVLFFPSQSRGGSEWAVLRITSHGCSGTVIYADDSKSLVLSCAHMFLAEQRYPGEPERIDPNLIARSFTFDAPHPNPGSNPRPGIRLLKYDVPTDLCLIQVNTRLPYVCPVAPVNSPVEPIVASCGYDLMQWPAVVRKATLDGKNATQQFTLERPRSGRSGGPLIGKYGLVGVCTGYMGKPSNLEVVPGGFGIYVSHPTICRFLGMTHVTTPNPVVAPTPVPVPAIPAPAIGDYKIPRVAPIDGWDGSYRAVPRPSEWREAPRAPSVGERRELAPFYPAPYMPPASHCPTGT